MPKKLDYGKITMGDIPVKSNGMNIREIAFRRKKAYTRQEIKDIASEYRSKLLTKPNFRGSIQVIQFVSELGWKSGKFVDIRDGEPDIFDMVDYADRFHRYDNDKFTAFNIYVKRNNRPTSGRTSDKGDCFFKCLHQCLPTKKLPFKTDAQLKAYFLVQKSDGIDISLIPKIEKLMKGISINVTGDHSYTSSTPAQYIIHLKLINGHFTVDNKKMKRPKLRISNFEKIPLVYDRNNGQVHCYYYNSKNEFITETTTEKRFNDQSKSPFLNIPLPRAYNPKQYLDEFIKKATELKIASNFDINMFKSGNEKNTALDYFYRLNQGINPQPVSEHEASWIDKCTTGALIFAEKGYEGKGYQYDFTSHYPSIMKDKFFRIPIKCGTFMKITNLKKLSAGIYRVHISEINPRLFRYNKFDYYTHTDIYLAKSLNGRLELIQDDHPNLLSYPPDTMITGEQLFGAYVDTLFELKQQKINGGKELLNILWGGLCQVDRTKHIIASGDLEDEIEFIVPYDETTYYVSTYKKDNKYKTPYARLAPFLLASGRKKISDVMKPYVDSVVRSHTDSMLVTHKLDIKTGYNIGDLKFEGFYEKCRIVNVNNIEGEMTK